MSTALHQHTLHVPPGSSIGILGSGQLGQMSAQAAQGLGYKTVIYAPPEPDGSLPPAAQVSQGYIAAPWDDYQALKAFAEQVAVVTVEFENIPVQTLDILSTSVPVFPDALALQTFQHRGREKMFFRQHHCPTVPFEMAHTPHALTSAVQTVGYPCVVKTAGFGYDGKGQTKLNNDEELCAFLATLHTPEAYVVEGWVNLNMEISVIGARTIVNSAPQTAIYPPFENHHHNHILDVTRWPARVSESLVQQAQSICLQVMEALDYRGLLCIEFFITQEGQLLINEAAPRPHNSGHITLEAAHCSQFEQHIRAICGLPLGPTTLCSPGAMVNLLGDHCPTLLNQPVLDSTPQLWPESISNATVYPHWYGKRQAKLGRKLGHLTVLADTPNHAAEWALQARQAGLTSTIPHDVSP